MVKEFLKIAGVKTQAEFYKKYPSEEAFFRAHPEAQQLVHQKMAYGGGMYAYAPGGPILPGTMSKAIADYKQSQAQPVVGADGMTNFIRRPQDAAPVAAPSAGAGQQHFALNPYQGVSVYDMLEAQGKAGDYNSRKGLAKTLGIPNYRGLPNQNAQMMEMIRQNPDVLLNYTGAPAPTKRSTKRAANGNALSGYSEDEIAAARAANPALFETDEERQARQNPFIMAPGQPAVDTPRSLKDYLPQLGRGTSEKDLRIIERQNAKDFNERKTGTFTLPNGKTKTYDQMTWKEKAYVAGKSLEGKGRFNEGDEAWYDKVNPLAWITGMAGALGEAPLQSEMSGSAMPVVSAIAAPVAAGAGAGYLNYFKPRYEPYYPPNKQLPGAGPIAGQRALPPSQRALPAPQMKQLPPSTPRGWTMGEGAYRSPNYPFHAQGGQPCYNCGGGMYADGGENDYSGTYSNGVYYGAGGTYIPMPMQPGDPLPQYMYGMRDGGGLKKYQDVGNVDSVPMMHPYIPDAAGSMLQEVPRSYPPMYMPSHSRNLSELAGQNAQGLSNQMFNDWRSSYENSKNLYNLNNQYPKDYFINPKTGKVGTKNKNGGLVKGSVHDMSEAQIQDLINQGYKIQYV